MLGLFKRQAMEIGDGSDEAIAKNKVEFLAAIDVLKMDDTVLAQFTGARPGACNFSTIVLSRTLVLGACCLLPAACWFQ